MSPKVRAAVDEVSGKALQYAKGSEDFNGAYSAYIRMKALDEKDPEIKKALFHLANS